MTAREDSENVTRRYRLPFVSRPNFRQICGEGLETEAAAISDLPEPDFRAVLYRITELQGESGTFLPDVVRRIYEELKAAGKIK